MKIFHSGDWHIGNFKGPEKDGVNLRSLDTKRCLETLAERAEQEKPELVLVRGMFSIQGRRGVTAAVTKLLQRLKLFPV